MGTKGAYLDKAIFCGSIDILMQIVILNNYMHSVLLFGRGQSLWKGK